MAAWGLSMVDPRVGLLAAVHAPHLGQACAAVTLSCASKLGLTRQTHYCWRRYRRVHGAGARFGMGWGARDKVVDGAGNSTNTRPPPLQLSEILNEMF